jgi:hypothetical protein
MALSHIHHGFRDVRRRQAKGELLESVEVLGREEADVAEYVGVGGGEPCGDRYPWAQISKVLKNLGLLQFGMQKKGFSRGWGLLIPPLDLYTFSLFFCTLSVPSLMF